MELSQKVVFVRFAISLVLPASDQPKTVSHALQDNSSTKVDVGLNVPLFLFRELAKMPPALTLALMVSTRYLKLNVLNVLLSVPLAQDLPTTVPHASTDPSPSMDHAQLCVVRTSSASKDSVLLVQLVVMDAETTLKPVSNVLKDT